MQIFRISRGEFFLIMMSRYGRGWGLAAALLVVAGIIASILVDLRWLIVALMILFIVTPGIAALLYFSKGLKKECYINILPHTVLFEQDGLLIETFREVRNNIEETEFDIEPGAGKEELAIDEGKREIEYELVGEIVVPYSELGRYELGVNFLTFPWKSGFVRIPTGILPDGWRECLKLSTA